MKKISILVFILLASYQIFAQPATAFNPKDHLGDTVTVTGRIYAGYYLINVITKPTFLNVYDSSPNHHLLLRIDSLDRKKFTVAPEKLFLNKKVSVTGVIAEYKGVAMIKITDSAMIEIDPADAGVFERPKTTGDFMTGRKYNFGQDSLTPANVTPINTTRKPVINRNLNPTINTTVDTTSVIHTDTTETRQTNVDTASIKVAVVPADTVKTIAILQPDTVKATIPVTQIDTVKKAAITDTVITKVNTKAEKPVTKKEKKPNLFQPIIEYPEEPVKETKKVDTVQVRKQEPVKAIATETIPEVASKSGGVTAPIVETDPVAKPTTTLNTPDTSKQEWLRKVSKKEFTPSGKDVRLVEDDIPMSVSPTTDAPVIAIAKKGMRISIQFVSDKWSYVVVVNPDNTLGTNGFIKNKKYKKLKKVG